jgi:formamidopyrimidine-DNA glycosylase
MPELPEVEAAVRSLREAGLERMRIKTAHVLRSLITRPQPAEEIEQLSSGVTVRSARRRAKNIIVDLSNDYSLRIHLRMTGDLKVEPVQEVSNPAVRAWWELGGGKALTFTDARALGRVHVYKTAELEQMLRKLGPEPLSRQFTLDLFLALAKRSRMPTKLFLMDQTKIAGLGNIYSAEALFRAGISPLRPMSSVSTRRLERLRLAIRETLRSAVHSIYKAYRSPGGYRNHFDGFERFVYGRAGEKCVRCGRPVQKMQQGGRSTYFCAHCQR